MRTTTTLLGAVAMLAVARPASAGCPVGEAKIEKAIATKPEFRDKANAQVVRDLRTLRDAALVLDAYDRGGACREVVAVLNTLAADPEFTLKTGTTDEDKAEAAQKARKPLPVRR